MLFVSRAFGNFLRIYAYLVLAFGTIWLVGLASDRAIQKLSAEIHLSFVLGIAALALSCVVTALEMRQLRYARIAASAARSDPYRFR